MNIKLSSRNTLTVVLRVLILFGLVAAMGIGQPGRVRAATTWQVPGDFVTIQAALNAAVNGDTILVGPGTYTEHLNFHGKDITLQSETGPTYTTISVDNNTAIQMGPGGKVIGFHIYHLISGTTARAAGFNVTGAGSLIKANVIEGFNLGVNSTINGTNTNVVIDGNIFKNNTGGDPVLPIYYGMIGFSGSSAPLLINNIFYNNNCIVLNFGMEASVSPKVINNTFVHNTTAILNDLQYPNASHVYRNNILLYNYDGLEVFPGTYSFAAVWDHNLRYYDGSTNYDFTGQNGNISVNPQLYPDSQPPYMLQHGSPVIDAGSNSLCPDHDFRDMPRPRGSLCDMGAFEGYANMVTSIVRDNSSPTDASSVGFTVTFLEAVTGLDTTAPFSDFALMTSGAITGAAITAVSGSGFVYDVTVNTGAGSDSLGLKVVDDDSILDPYSLPLGGPGTGNGNFTAGEVYAIDRDAPTVHSSIRADPDPAESSYVHFNVTFSEAVTGVDAGDFAVTTAGSISGQVSDVSGSGSTYQVRVRATDGLGTLRLDVPAGATAVDQMGFPLTGLPYIDGETYTFDQQFEYLYLPLVGRPKMANIYGHLFGNGLPMQGLGVELRWWNGSAWYTIASTSTEDDGFYGFNGVPSLGPGQFYHVQYANHASTPGILGVWNTRDVSSYTAGSNVFIGDFDVADVELISPYSGQTVGLPYTFQWTARTHSPSDSYEFDLFDYTDGNPYFYTPPLGHAGSYTLSHLPAGFSTGTQYAWYIFIYGPDGSYGVSFYANLVSFSNRGVSSSVSPISPSGQESHSRPAWPDIPESFLH